jgi:hypothetical protein
MNSIRDLSGQISGRWTVTNQYRRVGKRRFIQWLCQCSCGSPKKWIASGSLVSGRTISCGCARSEITARTHFKHGHAGHKHSKTYQSWAAMWQRTTYWKARHSHRYIERGIKVEEPRWRDFEEFLKDMGPRPPGTTLHRIRNNAGYSPRNCRWATPTDQNRNSSHVKLTFGCAVKIALRRLRGESVKSIAAAWEIHPMTVWNIAAGKNWKGAAEQARRQLDRATSRRAVS